MIERTVLWPVRRPRRPPCKTLLALALCLTAARTTAQEFVTAPDRLSDDHFYRLVACAAPPFKRCQKDFVRWSDADARDVSVAVVQVDDRYPAAVRRKVEASLAGTIAKLNAVGANLHLGPAPDGVTPDIRIFLLDIAKGAQVARTGLAWFDGQNIGLARFQMGWRDDGSVIECAIAVSRDAAPRDVPRILIEEITQCLGLMTDIGGPYYESRSIFSETGSRAELGEQDIIALRRHYP